MLDLKPRDLVLFSVTSSRHGVAVACPRRVVVAISDEMRFRIIRLIESRPEVTQREIASDLNVSLGKVNYCVKALVEKGLVKVGNFQKNPNKIAYLYMLTPSGIQEKLELTHAFLRHKLAEHEQIRAEIGLLRADLVRMKGEGGGVPHRLQIEHPGLDGFDSAASTLKFQVASKDVGPG